MATDTAKVLETLGKMTVLELVELKKAIEEEWGVTAAAPVAVAAAPGAPAAGDGAAAAYPQEGYAQDGYAGATGGYHVPAQSAGQAYPGDGYAGSDAYGQSAAQQPGYGYQQTDGGYTGSGTLDETSFFDTSMIDAEQLRRYQQERP